VIKDTFIELTIDGKIYDVSDLLVYGSFSINELFCNSEYTSSLNSCSFELKFNEDIFFALRDTQEIIKIKVFSEEISCIFEGTMDPVFSNDWTVPSEPENIKLEAVDFTEALDNKIEESITLPAEIGDSGFWIYKRGEESSSIIAVLLEKAGMANRISDNAPDIPIQILHLAVKKNDATYREVIDALLKDYQHVFTIVDGNYITWGKTSYQTINENEIETIDEQNILGNNSKKFRISKKYEVYNGIKLTWPKTKIMEDALLWRGNLPVGYSETILPGDSIASQDYWPSDSDIVETWMNFETDYLDTDYLSRKTRLKNEDIDLISSSNQYIKDIKDEGVVLDDIEGETIIFEGLRARFRYKNTSSEIKKLYWSEVYGKALVKDSNVETVFPENSSNPKSVPTNYIYDKDSAQTVVEAQWAQLKNGGWIIKFSSLKELKPGQVIKIKQLKNRWNGFALVLSRSKIYNFSGVFEYECRSISATETLSVTSTAQVNSTKTNGIKGDKGDQGVQGLQGIQGETGEQGIPGEPGANGLTSYFHVKYSDHFDGTDMNDTGGLYIGTYSDHTLADSTLKTDYTWVLVKGAQGETGEQGISGIDGTDGSTAYLHIKYSNDNGATFTANSGEEVGLYIGTYTDHTLNDSTSVSTYKWAKIKGEKGDVGPQGIQGIQGETGADAPLVSYQLTIYSNISVKPAETSLSNPDGYIPTGWSQSIPERTIEDIIYVSVATVKVNASATEYIDTIFWSEPSVYLTTEVPLQLQIEYNDTEGSEAIHILGSNSVDQSSNAKIRYKTTNYTILANTIEAVVERDCYIALVNSFTVGEDTFNTKLVYPSYSINKMIWKDVTGGADVADIICLIGRVSKTDDDNFYSEPFSYGKSPQDILENNFMKILSNAKDKDNVENADLNNWATAMGIDSLVGTLAVLKAFVDQLIVNHVSLTENGSIDSLSDDEKTKFHVTKDKIEIKNADIENITAKNATVDNIIATALKTYNNVSASSSPVVCPSADYWKRTDLEALCPNANQIYNLDTSHNTYDTKTYKYLIRSTGSSVNFASYTFAGTNHTTYSSSFSVKTGGNYSFSLKLPYTIDEYETDKTATCTVTSSYGTASASNPAHPSSATPHNGNVRYSDGSTTYTKSLSPGQTVTFDGYVVSTSAPYYTWTEDDTRNRYPTCTVTSSVGGFSKSVTSTMSTINWVWGNIATDTNITVKIEWLNSYYTDDKVDGFFTANQTYETGLLLYATDSTKTKIANNESYSNKTFDLTVGTINKISTSLKIYVGLKDYIATLRGSNDSIVIPCQYQDDQSAITSYYGISPTKNGVDTVSVTTTTLAFYKEGILKATYSTSDYIENFISQIVKITANIRIVTQEIMPDSNGVRDVGSTSNQFRDVYANRFHGIVYAS